MADWRQEIARRLQGLQLRMDEEMKNHTTFRIGGPADLMVLPQSREQLLLAWNTAREMELPITVTGCGSNLLVGDKGIRGVVLKIGEGMAEICPEERGAWFGAGIRLSRAAEWAHQQGLTGMEFAHGIPGSMGGAVYMNAGAYGGEIRQIVTETQYLTGDGRLLTFRGEENDFGYRHSRFSQMDGVIVAAHVELRPGDPEEIGRTMRQLAERRREKQPLNFPSAGSTFKRPEGYFAGQLIEQAGLKGTRVGGAMVSEKHAGFVVSDGTATCRDVLELIELVRRRVLENAGVELQCEVRLVGEN